MLLFLLFLSFDRLIAVVGTEAITEQEVTQLSRLYPGMNREELLDKMIIGMVVVNVAREETITVSDEEVNNTKSNILQQMPGLQVVLSHPYIDSLYNEELRIQLYTRKLTQREFQGKINVSPKEVRNFYKTHKDSLALPAMVTLERLMISITLEGEDPQERLALEIISQYRSGSDFDLLAKQYSDDRATKYRGGRLGLFVPEDLPSYLQGVSELKKGEVDIFESPNGYHIVLVKESDIKGIELAHIFLRFDFSNKEIDSAHKRAVKIRKRWLSEDSTLTESITPMGSLPVAALGEPLSTVIDSMKVGGISNPIQEGSNFYLLRVADKREGGIPPFEDVKENIRNILYQRKTQEALNVWIERAKKYVYIVRL